MKELLFIKDWTVEGTKTGWRNTQKLQRGTLAIPSQSEEEERIYPCCRNGERLTNRHCGHGQGMKPLPKQAQTRVWVKSIKTLASLSSEPLISCWCFPVAKSKEAWGMNSWRLDSWATGQTVDLEYNQPVLESQICCPWDGWSRARKLSSLTLLIRKGALGVGWGGKGFLVLRAEDTVVQLEVSAAQVVLFFK